MKETSILFLLTFFAACTFTQKVKDGDFAIERKQYAVAIPLLQKEHKKAKTKADKSKKAWQLAECYRQLNKPSDAATWYKSAYDDGFGTDALREYAYSLKSMQQYEDAMKAFKELGIEIGSPYEYKREIGACQVALGWTKEKAKEYSVKPVEFNSQHSDYAPTLYKDRQLVFTSDRSAAAGDKIYNWTGNDFSDLFLADIETQSIQPFDNQINTSNNEGTAVFNRDYSEMYFTRCFGEKKEDYFCKILVSKRIGEEWSAPSMLPFVQEGVNYGHPAISADGKTLIFSGNATEGGWGGYDLWRCERPNAAAEWGEPTAMSRSINTAGNEKFPFLDGDTLYFSSDWHPGMGGLDIFKTWKNASSAWTPVQNLKTPLNSGADDFGFVMDYQGRKAGDVLAVGYFTSNRMDGTGSDDIYRFEKRVLPPEPPKPELPATAYKLLLNCYVLEKVYADTDNPDSKLLGRKPLQAATVKMKFGKETKSFTVGEDGMASIELLENADYQFFASKNAYLNGETTFSTKGIGRDAKNPVQTFEVEIVLERIFLNKEIILENIYYDYDKWDIRADAQPTLNQLARNLELNPDIRIQLSSHTDCRGNDGYNEDLSQRRAQSAVDYLVSKGISIERLQAKGYGENALKVDCLCNRCSEEEHQLNRRTTFTILE